MNPSPTDQNNSVRGANLRQGLLERADDVLSTDLVNNVDETTSLPEDVEASDLKDISASGVAAGEARVGNTESRKSTNESSNTTSSAKKKKSAHKPPRGAGKSGKYSEVGASFAAESPEIESSDEPGKAEGSANQQTSHKPRPDPHTSDPESSHPRQGVTTSATQTNLVQANLADSSQTTSIMSSGAGSRGGSPSRRRSGDAAVDINIQQTDSFYERRRQMGLSPPKTWLIIKLMVKKNFYLGERISR